MDTHKELQKLREYVGVKGKLNDIEINKEIIEDENYYRLKKILEIAIVRINLGSEKNCI